MAAPSSQPSGCVSITTYGAVANDGIDDTAAIQRAVTANQNGEIGCVWIPAGQWRQEQKILTDDPLNRGQWNQVGISDVTIRGAGMWHSQLYTLTPPHRAGGSTTRTRATSASTSTTTRNLRHRDLRLRHHPRR
ncbi:hypothetical protein SMICM17S_07497 [Streptomyces microflavus]